MTAERPVRPLLTVKHVVPPVRSTTVPRRRLVAALQSARTRLTTVVAPAGWGKTSLLGAWAADPGTEERVAWVSLDEGDDDPARFWSYALTALRSVNEQVAAAALDSLTAGVDPVDLALPILLNELATTATPHVLVLDDYHTLTNPLIHESVEFLVAYLPAALRLVVSGRADPPLPLPRMRARGDLTELRAADLRFTLDEAAALVSGVVGADVDAATVEVVWDRTEGWAAGLQLTGLAMKGRPSPPAAVRDGDLHVLDYFGLEILPGLAPEQRRLLARSAPLERLSGSLCDAVLDVEGSGGLLAALDRADLFVVALDEQREWYRCHHLLRDALLRDPAAGSAADRRDVLRRAASWFADHGQLDDAVRCLLGAEDAVEAAALLASAERWFLERGAAAGLLRLGEELPSAVVGPQLALALAFAASTCRPDRVTYWLDACDRSLTADTVVAGWRSPRAAAATIRAVYGTSDANAEDAVVLSRQAVEWERAAGGEHPMQLTALGTALARTGRFGEAAPILLDSWNLRGRGGWSSAVTLQIAGVLALCLFELGREDALEALLGEAEPLARDAERTWGPAAHPLVALMRLVQGLRLYRRGAVEDARAALVRAAALSEAVARPSTRVLALVALADAQLGCGDRPAGRASLRRAREIVDEEQATLFAMARLDAAETRLGRSAARVARRSGDLVEDLTDRELSILRALGGTATQREIGAALFLSINTVKAYNKSLYRKLGVASRQDAVAAGRQFGLI